MPTANLYLVTRTLQRLLELNVPALLLRNGLAPTVNVSTMPPERVGSVQSTLNLHLYHLMEDGYYKNLTPSGRGTPPVSLQPLAVSLFYILTAHHEVSDVFDAEVQQQLFGLAMKTFHDFPVIDDGLQISPDGGLPQTVMANGLDGGGNRIEVLLRPLTPEEAMGFWAAEQVSTTRLSAYYEVRTIFLQPESPTGTHNRVYDRGLLVSGGRAPRIDRVASWVAFAPPAQTGAGPQVLDTAPARATLAPGSVPPANRVRLQGSAMRGDASPGAARIALRTPAWRQRTPPVLAAPIDPALNPTWNVELAASTASFELQSQLAIDDGAGGMVQLDVTPGIYAVAVETVRTRQTATGGLRRTTSASNQVAFSVGAHIDGFDAAGPEGRIVLRLVNAFDVTLPELDVQLAVDGVLYDETPGFADDPAQDQGLFRRQPGALELHPLFDPAQPGAHPVRLLIDGAESQPFWILTP